MISRSWDRKTYYAMRRIQRYLWWKENGEAKIQSAIEQYFKYGIGYIKIEVPNA